MLKINKSYVARIDANVSKDSNIKSILETLEILSNFVFEGGPEYWYDFKNMYKECRNKFSNLNSKIVQNFLQLYRPIKGRKAPKNSIKPIIILDNQNFNIKYFEDKIFTNYWLRFGRRNYPLRGKRILQRIKDINNVQECRIYIRNNKLYCKMTYVEEVEEVVGDPTKSSGIDINTKVLVSSDNKFYSTKKLLHRKLEHKKNRMRHRNTMNYTKDFVHNLTNKIVNDLVFLKQEVLVLEDLKGLRKSASKKLKTSKGKNINYRINSLPFGMFRNILEYKCLNQGIQLVTIEPQYTSKTCSRCGCVTNTTRPTQSKFVCGNCNYELHSDLNAARNIRLRHVSPNESPVNLAPVGG